MTDDMMNLRALMEKSPDADAFMGAAFAQDDAGSAQSQWRQMIAALADRPDHVGDDLACSPQPGRACPSRSAHQRASESQRLGHP